MMQQTYYYSHIAKYCIRRDTLNRLVKKNGVSLCNIVKRRVNAEINHLYNLVNDNDNDANFWRNVD